MIKEYRSIQEVAGPLMVVSGVEGVTYDELGEIELPNGEVRRCRVLEVNGRNVLVQLFESSAGLNLAESKVRFTGHGVELPVSEHMLGRVFNGMGEPIDEGAPIIPDKSLDINGTPINPAARLYPSEFIQTGISTIDGLNTLVRGQKLPIFSGSGLPHANLAAQIARQAKVRGTDGKFAVVHNGIIENYIALREELIQKGYRFESQTDTEVIVHLIEMYYTGDLKKAVIKTSARLQGSYALGVVCTDEPEKVYVVRESSPLILGVGVGENAFCPVL